MGNVIPARGQVREKLNAIIAGVQWIEKETVAPNSIPINLQNMKYLAAGVRGCFSLFAPDYRDPRELRLAGSNTADTDTCSRGFLITIGGWGEGGALHRCIRHSTAECSDPNMDPDSFGNVP